MGDRGFESVRSSGDSVIARTRPSLPKFSWTSSSCEFSECSEFNHVGSSVGLHCKAQWQLRRNSAVTKIRGETIGAVGNLHRSIVRAVFLRLLGAAQRRPQEQSVPNRWTR